MPSTGESFRVQIEAARQTGKPIIVRTNEDAEILETEMEKGVFTGVLHCFSSGAELAGELWILVLYQLSGILTFGKQRNYA